MHGKAERERWIQRLRKHLCTLSILLPELTLLAGFIVFFQWLKTSADLPDDQYETTFIAAAYVRSILTDNLHLLGAAVLTLTLIMGRRRLGATWDSLEQGKALRVFVGITAMSLAWPLTTSSYNFLVDQSLGIDRLLIAVLAVAIVCRPVFVLPFLLVATPLTWMRDPGIGIYPWEFFGMPLRCLALFTVWFLAGAWTGAFRFRPFLFTALCIVAGHYWIPGNIKLRVGWLLENDIYYLLPATYNHGWLSCLEPQTISRITRAVSYFNVPMKLGTLMLECGSLFMLAGRVKTVPLFLAAFVCFHAAVVLLCGIFMWQWAVVELALLLALWRSGMASSLLEFTHLKVLASIVIIGLAPLWLRSASLAWFDSPVTYAYRFDTLSPDGKRENLSPQFFAPFDMQFTFSQFHYLVPDQPLLGIAFGATDRYTAARLKGATTEADVFALEQEWGGISFDANRTERMGTFLTRFLTNYNAAPEQSNKLPWIAPPPGLLTVARENAFPGNTQVHRVDVTFVTSYFDGVTYREIRHLPVLTVEVPNANSPGPVPRNH